MARPASTDWPCTRTIATLGLGRLLVHEGEARLRGLGARRLSLFAVEAHDAAMAFWPAVGYQRDHMDVRFVMNLSPTPDPRDA